MVYLYKYYLKNIYLPTCINKVKASNHLELSRLKNIQVTLRISKKEFAILNSYLFFVFKNIFYSKEVIYKVTKNDIYISTNLIVNKNFNFYYHLVFLFWIDKSIKSINWKKKKKCLFKSKKGSSLKKKYYIKHIIFLINDFLRYNSVIFNTFFKQGVNLKSSITERSAFCLKDFYYSRNNFKSQICITYNYS